MNEQPDNLVSLLLHRLAVAPDAIAIRFRSVQAPNEIQQRSWSELVADVFRVAGSLMELGIRPGDRVAQLSENRYEWILVDLAIPMVQAIHVPIHAPLAAAQVLFQVQHCQARALIVSQAAQFAKLQAVADHLRPELQLITFDSTVSRFAQRGVIDFHADWLGHADTTPAGKAAAEQARAALRPTTLASILYTSGTTGEPKGVMLSHGNLVANARGVVDAFGMDEREVKLGFLPLSHIFARTCDLYTWLSSGFKLCLATNRESVLQDCQWARPTALSGVPYFFDRVSREFQARQLADQPDGLRQLFGGAIHYVCSGGAALPGHLFDFYYDHGVPCLEGYGLTETSPVITVSTPASYRRGSVGRVIPHVELRVTDQGELTTRGPHVMQGYWQDRPATDGAIRDGWFHTGDLGHIDDDGFVWISGRAKEIIVTAAGKNVGPVLLESLMTEDPLIDQAMVVGDDRNYLTALIVPNWPAVRDSLPNLPEDLDDETYCHQPDVLALMRRVIDERLAEVSYHEQIRKFVLLEQAFSLERQEVTPKLSLCRPVILRHYAAQIGAMYGDQPRPEKGFDST